MKEFIKQQQEEAEFKAELAIHWNILEKYLPKSIEIEALGHRKIFEAFANYFKEAKSQKDTLEKVVGEEENDKLKFSADIDIVIIPSDL